jgi:hypothetical protein
MSYQRDADNDNDNDAGAKRKVTKDDDPLLPLFRVHKIPTG